MKNKKPKIYGKEALKDLVQMHRSNNALAKRFGVYPATMSNAINGKAVQASFVAVVIKETGIPFDKLFEVR